MLVKLEFEEYVPVQHQLTEAFYAFLIIENRDFDTSVDNEMYACYPITEDGSIDVKLPFSYSKKDLRTI